MNKKLAKRYFIDKVFLYSCIASVCSVITILMSLLVSIVFNSWGSFWQAEIKLTIDFSKINKNNPEEIENYLQEKLKNEFLNDNNLDLTKLFKLLSLDSPMIIKKKYADTLGIKTIWLPTSSLVGVYLKNRDHINDKSYMYILDKLKSSNLLKLSFTLNLFTQSDSTEPESAGILGGLVGSLLTMLICIASVLPIGVFSAVFLEEYKPPKLLKYLIEVNINNLAAVPSIVYGLLGLAVLINYLSFERSSALVGGITLGLLTLPTVIVTTRQSIRAIPDSIRHAILALGASPMQVTMHHILPMATPGIITGIILSISRAIGETAPLIMLGMVAFISEIPMSFSDPTTVMPVLIYTWSDSPEHAFVEKTSAAILVLVLIILSLNYFAIRIRNKYELRI